MNITKTNEHSNATTFVRALLSIQHNYCLQLMSSRGYWFTSASTTNEVQLKLINHAWVPDKIFDKIFSLDQIGSGQGMVEPL